MALAISGLKLEFGNRGTGATARSGPRAKCELADA